MFEAFEFIGDTANYAEDNFQDVVRMLLCDYLEAGVFIQYINSSRTTHSYKAVMSTVKRDIPIIKHLIIDASDVTFYVSPTSAKVIVGNVNIKQVLANHMYINVDSGMGSFNEKCPDLKRVPTVAAKLIATPNEECIYCDNCNEIDYITPKGLEVLNVDLDNLYELCIEGTYKGRPAFVGITPDSDLYINACNSQVESEHAYLSNEDPFTWDDDK